jgi:hypothetical protein
LFRSFRIMIDNIAGHDYEIGLLSVDCVEGSSVRLFVSVKICASENLHWSSSADQIAIVPIVIPDD